MRKPQTAVAIAQLKKPGRYAVGDGVALQISKWHTRAWVFRYERLGRAHSWGSDHIPPSAWRQRVPRGASFGSSSWMASTRLRCASRSAPRSCLRSRVTGHSSSAHTTTLPLMRLAGRLHHRLSGGSPCLPTSSPQLASCPLPKSTFRWFCECWSRSGRRCLRRPRAFADALKLSWAGQRGSRPAHRRQPGPLVKPP